MDEYRKKKIKPNGIDNNNGLKALVENSCWKKILKKNTNKAGAYSNLETIIWAGVRKATMSIIKNSILYLLLILARSKLTKTEAIM